MTSKLTCPFCQQELGIILCDIDDLVCSKCRMCGTKNLWAALIQAKQDLETISAKYAQSQKPAEITRQALREIRYCKSAGFDLPAQTPWEIIAEKALEQIDHFADVSKMIEQKDTK